METLLSLKYYSGDPRTLCPEVEVEGTRTPLPEGVVIKADNYNYTPPLMDGGEWYHGRH